MIGVRQTAYFAAFLILTTCHPSAFGEFEGLRPRARFRTATDAARRAGPRRPIRSCVIAGPPMVRCTSGSSPCEVELQRRVGRRDHPQRGIDRVDCARIEAGVEESDLVAQDRHRFVDAIRDCVRVSSRLPESQVLQLLDVFERGSTVEPPQPVLEAITHRRHRFAPE